MKWHKQGLLYVADNTYSWASSHAMLPTPILLNNGLLRIYLTFCDKHGIGRVGFVDVLPQNPKEIVQISTTPVLDIGQPGAFDDNGVLQTSIVQLSDGRQYLYYVGFELGTKIRYRLLTGLAICEDGSNTFHRVSKSPVLERSDKELFFRCGSFVLLDNHIFKIWYVAGSEWTRINGKEMPVYIIKYMESQDGVQWGDEGHICISIENDAEHGFGRPYVYKQAGRYKMFYSIRMKKIGYRLGYAESDDGINWQRLDHKISIDVSSSGWDSEMICYSSIIHYQDKTYLFYNGNDFGRTGVGYAILE